jgi:drug/metabolite transporter (DMT)-like permease
MTERSNARGILAMVASCVAFVVGDAAMKVSMGDGLPPFEVLTIRGIVASLTCMVAIVVLGQAGALRHALNRWVLIRAAAETAALFCFIQALPRMPQGDLTAIFQISPLLVVVGAAVIFGERIGPAMTGFLALGFAGALLVAQPGAAGGYAAAPLGLIGAVLVAGRDLAARRTPAGVPTLVATLTTLVMVLVAAASASALVEAPVWPVGRTPWLLVLAGVLVMAANFLVIHALRVAEIGVLAPFFYTFTLAAMLAGYVVFGDVPNRLAMAGIALIVASGIAVLLLDAQGKRRAAAG